MPQSTSPNFLDYIQMAAMVVSAATLVATLIGAYFQLRNARQTQQGATARALWDNYLKIAMENPDLAFPPRFADRFNYAKRKIKIADSADGRREQERFEQYEWFVSILLRTSQEVLEIFPRDQDRIGMVRRNIRYHRDYLVWRKKQLMLDDYIDFLGADVKHLVDQVVREEVWDSQGAGSENSSRADK